MLIVLIDVLRQEKYWNSQHLLRKFSGKNWVRTSVDRLLKKINSTGVTERPKGSGLPRSVRVRVGISENIELVDELICSHEHALHTV